MKCTTYSLFFFGFFFFSRVGKQSNEQENGCMKGMGHTFSDILCKKKSKSSD